MQGTGKRALTRALLLTAASVLVPGTAHLRRRHWRGGLLLLSLFLAAVALVAFAATGGRRELVRLVLDPAGLRGIVVGAVALALAWSAGIVWSFAVVRPRPMSPGRWGVATVTVIGLCGVVCAPLLLAASYAQAQRGLVTGVFSDVEVSAAPGDDDPWQRTARLNVLLLGGDAGPTRRGMRTDVIVLASVDPTTGRTVLLSLPRNLQWAPMPFEAMRERFPDGFPDFLYGLWRYGQRHPQLVPGTRRPGPHLLTETVEEITGLPVHYYVLVDLDGFEQLIDALGGVWINVREPVRFGEEGQFVVRAGYHKLNGFKALWYARSRYGASDYARMQRQRCMLGALANQASPMTVLRNFRELARTAERTVSTDIPHELLPHLVDLAPKIGAAATTNMQFVPPLVGTGDPDYAKIRRIAQAVTGPPQRPTGVSPATPAEEGARAVAPPLPGGAERLSPSPGERAPAVSLRAACPTVAAPAQRSGR